MPWHVGHGSNTTELDNALILVRCYAGPLFKANSGYAICKCLEMYIYVCVYQLYDITSSKIKKSMQEWK